MRLDLFFCLKNCKSVQNTWKNIFQTLVNMQGRTVSPRHMETNNVNSRIAPGYWLESVPGYSTKRRKPNRAQQSHLIEEKDTGVQGGQGCFNLWYRPSLSKKVHSKSSRNMQQGPYMSLTEYWSAQMSQGNTQVQRKKHETKVTRIMHGTHIRLVILQTSSARFKRSPRFEQHQDTWSHWVE